MRGSQRDPTNVVTGPAPIRRAATGESSLVPGIGSLMLFALIPFFDRGLQWPHIVTDSGILATIAVAIVVYTPVALMRQPMIPALAVTGVLLVGLFAGHQGYDIPTPTQSLGFILFIYCVGMQAGPEVVRIFKQDGCLLQD